MEFVNHHIKRINPGHQLSLYEMNSLPKKNLSELEQLNNQMMNSMKTRLENRSVGADIPGNFEKMVHRTLGHDLTIVSELTKDFLQSKKGNITQ